jgi:hypothetical protein
MAENKRLTEGEMKELNDEVAKKTAFLRGKPRRSLADLPVIPLKAIRREFIPDGDYCKPPSDDDFELPKKTQKNFIECVGCQ